MRWSSLLAGLLPHRPAKRGFAERPDPPPLPPASPSQSDALAAAADNLSRRLAGDEALPFPHGTGPQGHRARMRDKLINRGADSLADYELLEMLLFAAQPKGDTKPLAKRLINRFGSFADVLTAPTDALLAEPGVGPHTVAAIRLAQESALRLARAEAVALPVMANWDALMAYLTAAMAREPIEQFRILFLDTRNRILADEVQARGTVNHTPVYPREVVKRALDLNATALILVHNHPSGDPTPSPDDIAMTEDIHAAADALGITLHDHIIIGKGTWLSFRRERLLGT